MKCICDNSVLWTQMYFEKKIAIIFFVLLLQDDEFLFALKRKYV